MPHDQDIREALEREKRAMATRFGGALGNRAPGHEVKPSTREKLRGMAHDDAAREKMRRAKIGVPLSREHKEAISRGQIRAMMQRAKAAALKASQNKEQGPMG